MWCCHCGGRWLLRFRSGAFAGGLRTAANGFNSRFPAGGSLGNMNDSGVFTLRRWSTIGT